MIRGHYSPVIAQGHAMIIIPVAAAVLTRNKNRSQWSVGSGLSSVVRGQQKDSKRPYEYQATIVRGQ